METVINYYKCTSGKLNPNSRVFRENLIRIERVNAGGMYSDHVLQVG
jgi:hypothetical protein